VLDAACAANAARMKAAILSDDYRRNCRLRRPAAELLANLNAQAGALVEELELRTALLRAEVLAVQAGAYGDDGRGGY
jgi:hypothetical protein